METLPFCSTPPRLRGKLRAALPAILKDSSSPCRRRHPRAAPALTPLRSARLAAVGSESDALHSRPPRPGHPLPPWPRRLGTALPPRCAPKAAAGLVWLGRPRRRRAPALLGPPSRGGGAGGASSPAKEGKQPDEPSLLPSGRRRRPRGRSALSGLMPTGFHFPPSCSDCTTWSRLEFESTLQPPPPPR